MIIVSAAEKDVLSARATSARAEHRMVIRARIVLAAAEGHTNAAIADDHGMHIDTVRKWRRRFQEHGIEGPADLPRSGRPVRFTAAQVAEVKALACTPPTETGVPLARWSTAELATEAVRQGLVETISVSTVGRWLAADAIKPWQHRSWIFPRDPDFATKAARVLDLYERRWQGVELGEDEYVISADEKSQLQALRRRHRGLPAAPGRTRRVEFEYRRGGTLAYFAAYDIHRAHVIGTIAPKTGIQPFTHLVNAVMSTEPYASAKRVFWVVDNGSSHNGQASVDRINQAWWGSASPLLASVRRVVIVLAAVVALVACNTAEDPAQDAPSSAALDYNEAEVVFARAMIPHREQGAAMSELVLQQKGLKPCVQALAVELRENRAAETDRLQQWVAERGEPVAAEAKHDHGGGEDGIATPSQMYALEEATGSAAQSLYVEMMTKHHRGAVDAAHEEIAHGKNPALVEFAQMILRLREEQLKVLLDAAALSVPAATPTGDPTTR